MSKPIPRPALDTLQHQQAELVDHQKTSATDLGVSLRHGVASRRELIRWYQAATVRTFGLLGETWAPTRLMSDPALLQACIVSRERERWASDGEIDLEVAAEHRRLLEENALQPAMHRAYNQLRKMAGEYIGAEDDRDVYDESDLDPASQAIAMRPAFTRKDAEQAQALRDLWGGFEDEDAVRDWLHRLDQPTNGGLSEDFTPVVMRDEVALSYLVRSRASRSEARLWREQLAIGKLLPAFRRGIQRMDTGELAKRTRTELEVKQG